MKLIIDIPNEVYKFIKDRGHLPYAVSLANMIEGGIPYEEQSKDKWVSITERLPKDDEDVLVTYVGSTGHSITDIAWFDELDSKFLSQDGKFEISNVVAWMPLLEPYKRGEEE